MSHSRYPMVANTIIKYVGNGIVYLWVSDDGYEPKFVHARGKHIFECVSGFE